MPAVVHFIAAYWWLWLVLFVLWFDLCHQQGEPHGPISTFTFYVSYALFGWIERFWSYGSSYALIVMPWFWGVLLLASICFNIAGA